MTFPQPQPNERYALKGCMEIVYVMITTTVRIFVWLESGVVLIVDGKLPFFFGEGSFGSMSQRSKIAKRTRVNNCDHYICIACRGFVAVLIVNNLLARSRHLSRALAGRNRLLLRNCSPS